MSDLTEDQRDAAQAVADLDGQLWLDLAERFTCLEAEVVGDFLAAFHGEGARTSFLTAHSIGDDEGDDHETIWHEDEDEQAKFLAGYRRRDFDA